MSPRQLRNRRLRTPLAYLGLWCGVLTVTACGPRQIADVEPPPKDVIVLLRNAVSGELGRAVVTTESGSVELGAHRESAEVVGGRPPVSAGVLTDDEVTQAFGTVLTTLPPPPTHFTLYFEFGSDELTSESENLLPEVLEKIAQRPVPEVVVVGHTDTVGSSRVNLQTGFERAVRVQTLLAAVGVDPSSVQVVSHGEEDLLVPTSDNAPEPRNRRVEIVVP